MSHSETIEDLEEDLTIIKEWLIKQKHLPEKIDDQLLRRFIVSCNRNLERTKHIIDLYYTYRSQAPEIFSNRDPLDKELAEYFTFGDTIPLPKTTDNNYKLIMFRVTKNPSHFIFSNILKTVLMIADVRLATELQITSGEVPIFDMANTCFQHLSKISLPVMKKYMMYTQEAHPVRLKQIHVINAPTFLDKLMLIVKPFIKKEVAAMLHFHSSLESLYKYVPRDLLPEEYGGKAGKITDLKAEWLKKIIEHRDYFLDENRWKVDESKRPFKNGKEKNFGIPGSFRSLNID